MAKLTPGALGDWVRGEGTWEIPDICKVLHDFQSFIHDHPTFPPL